MVWLKLVKHNNGMHGVQTISIVEIEHLTGKTREIYKRKMNRRWTEAEFAKYNAILHDKPLVITN